MSITFANYPSRPGLLQDALQAAIVKWLKAGRNALATWNMHPNVAAALAGLIREGYVAVDRDHACSLTAKGVAQ